MDKKKSYEQANIEGNLRRKMKKDLRNVEFWVKDFDIYKLMERIRQLRITPKCVLIHFGFH